MCPACNRPSIATVHETLRIGRRVVEWDVCLERWLREEAQQEARMAAAIEQAERAGV